jgi:anaerobic ribonucleoside-triphosphate reductase activating protein
LEDVDNLKKQISSVKNQDGVTLSGGDPMYQIEPCKEIAKFCKQEGLNVWCYTGSTFEELQEMINTNPDLLELLENIDVLVDGRFEIDKKSLNLHFKGSENQRILDVKESLKQGKAIPVKKFEGKKQYNNLYNHAENESKGLFI